MSVYVDNMRLKARVGRINARWSHLLADSDEELVRFAVSIGLKPAWIQHEEKRYGAHFDLTESKRHQAIAAGAIEVDWRDIPELLDKLYKMRKNKA